MARRIRDPQSQERIVEAARLTIAELGLRGATVRAIASEAGVSTGYVMHYFADKRVLASAVLTANNVAAGERVARAARGRRGLEAVRAAVEALLPLDRDRRLEWQVWAAFWVGGGADGLASDGLVRGGKALREILVGPFTEAITDGELPDHLDVRYECERLMTLAAGLGLTAGVGSQVTLRRLARRMLDDHLTSLTTRSAVHA